MSEIMQQEQLPAHLRGAVSTETGFDDIRAVSAPTIKVSTLGIKITEGVQVLAQSPAGTAMDLVLLASSPIGRTYYSSDRAYQEGRAEAPDCSSYDGVTPDSWRANIQSDSCASCPMNVIGSDPKNTNSRACRYRRTLVAISPTHPNVLLRLSLSATSMFRAPDVNNASTLEPYVTKLRTAGLRPHHVITQIMQSPESVQTRVLFRRVGYTTAELHAIAEQHLHNVNAIQVTLGNPAYFISEEAEEIHDGYEQQAQTRAQESKEEAPQNTNVASNVNVVLNYNPYQPIETVDEITYWRSNEEQKPIGATHVPLVLEVQAGQPLPDETWDELRADEYQALIEQQKILEQEVTKAPPPKRTRRSVNTGTKDTVSNVQDVVPPKSRRSSVKATQATGEEAGVATHPQTQALNTVMTELFGEDD